MMVSNFNFPVIPRPEENGRMNLSQCVHTFELDSAIANHSSIGVCHVCGVVMSNGVHWTLWESMTINVVIATGWPVMPVYVGW
jgi:hypothetical protein